MSTLDEEFNPKPTTVKEYLKILISQNEEFKKELKDLRNEVDILKRDLEKRNSLAEEREERHRTMKWVIGIVAAVAGALGAAVLESFLSKK